MAKPACEICRKFGDELHVNYLDGESFPPEFKDFVWLPETENDVCRCTECGQPYVYDHTWDNDVYNLMDYGTLKRITEERVREIIGHYVKQEKDRKERVKRFWYKARKEPGDKLAGLSVDETQVVEYLKDKMIDGAYIEMIAVVTTN
jgi:hypothetical protein